MTADVSVIIAAYNVEAYIERAIRSVLDQQGVTVEVIVINDCSTDNTAAIVSGINDSRIKLINLPANGGPSVARNAGIAAATAPWIAILDGDDRFMPERLLHCLTRAKAVKADIVIDNLQVYREEDGAEYPMFNPVTFPRIGMLDLARFITGNCSFLGGGEALGYAKPFFSVRFLKEHNLSYNPDLRNSEDYLLLCEALAHNARCIVDGSLGYVYTKRKGSISHRLTPGDVERIINGDKEFAARYKLSPAAQEAMDERALALKDALAYTKLLDALKAKKLADIMAAIMIYPPCVLHLWAPVWVRLKKPFQRRPKAKAELAHA